MSKEKFLIGANLQKIEGRPILRKTKLKTFTRIIENTIFQVIIVSIVLLFAKEISIFIWKRLN